MKTVGIIAEYNPFHNGHKYQIQKAKELTGADYCIVVMSGDFVQRGAPAIMDKYLRTRAALSCGADLVLELPVYYALQSAEYFATGAVTLLDKLGVVDTLCFGSECGDTGLLIEFADSLLCESETFKNILKSEMKSGATYPEARNKALLSSNRELAQHMEVLGSPNNILGIEYCKALKRRNSPISALSIKREGSSYHDASMSEIYCSALAIRESIHSTGTLSYVCDTVPDSVYSLMKEAYEKTFPIFPSDVSSILHYCLLSREKEGYTDCPDIDKDLSDRISRKLPDYLSFENFCELVKSKNRTYTRISRSLMHILLHMTKKDLQDFVADDYIYYARILGFQKDSTALLSSIKEKTQIPLISKLADTSFSPDSNAQRMLEKDICASHIYQSMVQNKFGQHNNLSLTNEFKRQIVRI